MKNIEEQYSKLKEKYSLPNFKEINKEFEISTIENEHFLLKEVINKITDRIDFFSRIFEEVLQPDPSILRSMYETKSFNDEERKTAFSLYKKLMLINRQSVEVSLKKEERQEADFIKKAFDEWKELKTSISRIVDKLKDSWKKEADSKQELGYLG